MWGSSLWWSLICGDKWSSLGMNMALMIFAFQTKWSLWGWSISGDYWSCLGIFHFKYLIMRSKIWVTLKIPLFGRWTILVDLVIQAPVPRNVSSLIPSLKAFSNSLRLCVRCTFEQMMNFGSHKKFRSDQTQRSLYL